MKKKLKKVLALFLCLAIFLSNISTYAQALNQVVKTGGTNNLNTAGVDDGVTVGKTIAATDVENYFDITLTVNTTSKIEEILKDQDLAIVVVMDVSNTMIQYNVDGTKVDEVGLRETRYQAAMEAGSYFIESFASNSSNANAARELGYVMFNSHASKVFDLQTCNDDKTAESLINDMATKTGAVVNASGYNSSHDRFTNIEAGLKLAKDMLATTNIQNKYIIFISDGFPTTYLDYSKSGYIGYDTYVSSGTSTVGSFYNNNVNKPCSFGASYSDLAARRASSMAASIKSSGIKVFSVGTGLDYQKTINTFLSEKLNSSFSVVDTDTTNYEIGNHEDDIEARKLYKNWLKNDIGSGYYYDTTDGDSLKTAYDEIFEKISEISTSEAIASWVANDPMNTNGEAENIGFVAFYDDDVLTTSNLSKEDNNDANTANFNLNSETISWDLKKSNYELSTLGGKTSYLYTLKYRIRLENENSSFVEGLEYLTNGTTTLTYVVRKDGFLSDEKTIDFPIPSVLGFLGEFEFYKVSAHDESKLKGAKFKLVHDIDNCACHTQLAYPEIVDALETSDTNGLVRFTNIPSGHRYKLIETEAPDNYLINDYVHTVEVSYGTTLTDINVDDNGNKYILNNIQTGDLKVCKQVTYGDNEKEFTFNLTANLKDGQYSAKKYYGDMEVEYWPGSVTFVNQNATFKLKHNEYLIIYNLPVNTTYLVEETEDNDYIVTSTEKSGTISSNSVKTSTFYNQKKPEPAEVVLVASKTMDDETPSNKFNFVLLKDNKIIQTKTNNGNLITFDKLTFSEEGEYVYYIKEYVENPDEKIVYDSTIYKVVIKITKGNNYEADVTYINETTSVNVAMPLFKNKTKPVSVLVNKLWENMDGFDYPKSVSVQLYRNGVAYLEPVELSKENEWSHTWFDLDGRYEYTVDEISNLEFFIKKVKKDETLENVWTITNINTLGVVLPETGKKGSLIYILTGASLMLSSFVGGCVFLFKKKKMMGGFLKDK